MFEQSQLFISYSLQPTREIIRSVHLITKRTVILEAVDVDKVRFFLSFPFLCFCPVPVNH